SSCAASLGPTRTAAYWKRVSQWWSSTRPATMLATVPEIAWLSGIERAAMSNVGTARSELCVAFPVPADVSGRSTQLVTAPLVQYGSVAPARFKDVHALTIADNFEH